MHGCRFGTSKEKFDLTSEDQRKERCNKLQTLLKFSILVDTVRDSDTSIHLLKLVTTDFLMEGHTSFAKYKSLLMLFSGQIYGIVSLFVQTGNWRKKHQNPILEETALPLPKFIL